MGNSVAFAVYKLKTLMGQLERVTADHNPYIFSAQSSLLLIIRQGFGNHLTVAVKCKNAIKICLLNH